MWWNFYEPWHNLNLCQLIVLGISAIKYWVTLIVGRTENLTLTMADTQDRNKAGSLIEMDGRNKGGMRGNFRHTRDITVQRWRWRKRQRQRWRNDYDADAQPFFFCLEKTKTPTKTTTTMSEPATKTMLCRQLRYDNAENADYNVNANVETHAHKRQRQRQWRQRLKNRFLFLSLITKVTMGQKSFPKYSTQKL